MGWRKMELLLLLLGVVGLMGMVECQSTFGSSYTPTHAMETLAGWAELMAEGGMSDTPGWGVTRGLDLEQGQSEVSLSVAQDRSDGYGHGHGHSGIGTACIVKGSYCQCHYCKCEHGFGQDGYKGGCKGHHRK